MNENELMLMRNYVGMHLEQNDGLTRLIALLLHACNDDIEFPQDKLIGDWDFARAGQKVKVTWTDPYRVEDGYLMFLPGLESSEVLKGGIVHIPNSYEDQNQQKWFVLKHLAIFAEQIELQVDL